MYGNHQKITKYLNLTDFVNCENTKRKKKLFSKEQSLHQ